MYSSRAIFSQFFAFLEAFSQKSPLPHTTTKINLNKYNPNYTPNNSHSLFLNKLTPAILIHTILHPLTHTYSPKMHLYSDPIPILLPHSHYNDYPLLDITPIYPYTLPNTINKLLNIFPSPLPHNLPTYTIFLNSIKFIPIFYKFHSISTNSIPNPKKQPINSP